MANVISDETIEYVGILARSRQKRIWQICLIILISLVSWIQKA